ncbi:transposase [Falsiroseomonas algicola]|uniref:transposase n=1 Tax=Falsiroseomonas algicola TaxID=2716930 RepID=UPI002E2A4ACC|nr:transposase [Falsiroseomonas algicola]
MRRSRFPGSQSLGILKEHEAGRLGADICRKHTMSDQTFYTRNSRLRGQTGALGIPIGPRA